MDGLTHNFSLAPHSSHLSVPSISMPISSSLPFSTASPRHLSVPSPYDCSEPIFGDSIPSPAPVSRSACKARPFSRSVGLSALSTIATQSHVVSLDDSKMLSTTSNTCTITGPSTSVAMTQDTDALFADKQGIKTCCPDQAENNDEIVKTPVQVNLLCLFIFELVSGNEM